MEVLILKNFKLSRMNTYKKDGVYPPNWTAETG
jgi:hypothetical protein